METINKTNELITGDVVRAQINEKAFMRSMKHLFASSFSAVGELLQNGRRAEASRRPGATSVDLHGITILIQDTGCKPTTAYVDLGYRGVDEDNPSIAIKHRGKSQTLTTQEIKLLKRRQAIEPIIGHLKQDHRMNRCHLKGEQGDGLHAVL